MIRRFLTYLERRRKHSYTELWVMVYGDGDQGKGLIRDASFAWEVAAMWRQSAKEKL